jgi:cysteine-rich repeat protein
VRTFIIITTIAAAWGCYASQGRMHEEPATCGNALVEAGEQCDDGNEVDWDGCNSCTISEFMVNTLTDLHQQNPDVAVAPDGSFIVVWEGDEEREEHTARHVFARRYDAEAASSSAEIRLDGPEMEYSYGPAVDMSPEGRSVVVWTTILGGAAMAVGLDPSGRPAAEAFVVAWTSSGVPTPSVGMAYDGSFVVAYCGSGGILAQRYDPEAEATGPAIEVSTTPHLDSVPFGIGPALATDAEGGFLMAWTRGDRDESLDVYGQSFGPGGESLTSDFLVNTTVRLDQSRPAAAISETGTHVVVWEGRLPDSDAWGIYGRLLDEESRPLGPEFMVNETPNGSQSVPDVAMDEGGGFVVVWDSSGPGDSVYDIAFRLYAPDGTPLTGERKANLFTRSLQSVPSVDMTPDGRFVIAWQSKEQLSAERELNIYAQRYDALGRARGLMAW